MTNCFKAAWLIAIAVLIVPQLSLASQDPLSSHDYDLHSGDFNGDGSVDILYVAKDPQRFSGILLGNGSGEWTSLQKWGNAFLGMSWSTRYAFTIADFNGDRRDDILAQSIAPGDHFLLFATPAGFGGIAQTIPNRHAGIDWSGGTHRIVTGDFNGDGRADLFLQAVRAAEVNAVVFADENGQFTARQPAQVWASDYLGFGWSLEESYVFAGDFNGDRGADLLIQARPVSGTGPGTGVRAAFLPGMNGVVTASLGVRPFVLEAAQNWDQHGFGAEWSPLSNTVHTGDFNADGRVDVLLSGSSESQPAFLLYGRERGAIFEPAVNLGSGVVPDAGRFRALRALSGAGGSARILFVSLSRSSDGHVVEILDNRIVTQRADLNLLSAVANDLDALDSGSSEASSLSSSGMSMALYTPTAAGRTPGQFAVSSTGAATYQIPLWTPPGARGLQPKLALTYMSNGPDGLLGPGWSLSGLSRISRCNKTFADNAGAPAAVKLTLEDEFCLDGNRLRYTGGGSGYGTPGSIYQTALAEFSRITAFSTHGNGPSYFIIEGKDGLLYEYGNSTDSKAVTVSGTTPYAWLLNKVRDRLGNNLKVVYETTFGDTQPTHIYYTQTPSTNGGSYPYMVSFGYLNRQTKVTRFIGGTSTQQTRVLAAITVSEGVLPVRSYNFSYSTSSTTQRDRLEAIQECSGSMPIECLRPTTIAYQSGSSGIANPATSALATSVSGLLIADFDANGVSDILYGVTSGSNRTWYVRFGSSTGVFGATINTGIVIPTTAPMLRADIHGIGADAIMFLQGSAWTVSRWNGSAFVSSAAGVTFDANSSNVLADTNGDGRADLVTLRTDQKIYIRLSTSTSTVPSFGAASLALDFGATPPNNGILYSEFGPSGHRVLDFNGDGRQDIVGYRYLSALNTFVYRLLISNGTTLTSQVTGSVSGFGYFNDDTCTDVVTDGEVRMSACNGISTYNAAISNGALRGVVDWNGDGRSDILVNASGGNVRLQRSLSDSFTAEQSTGFPASSGASYIPLDANGDGLSDLARLVSGTLTYGLHLGPATPADMATSIVDGWGVQASMAYVPMTASNYTKGTSAVFPDIDVQLPTYVVSQFQQSDGLGGLYTTSMWYWGARVNKQGRGLLGFSQIQSQDSRNGVIQRASYRQDYPYIGAVSQHDTYLSNGTGLLARTENTYGHTVLAGAGCASGRCFPYIDVATSTTYDASGSNQLLQSNVTDFSYDSYGNVTQLATSSVDEDGASPFNGQVFSSVISHTITPDVANWCLNRETVTTTQNSVPGQPSITRRVDHAVNYALCRFDSEILEPTNTLLKVTKTFGYNSCGNMTSTSVVGADETGALLPARTTSTSYGPSCQFPEVVTNPEAHQTTTAYYFDHGLPGSITDQNGAAVSREYDKFGRVVLEERPDGTSTQWSYADCVSATCWGVAGLRLLQTETLRDSSSAIVTTSEKYFDGLGRIRYNKYQRAFGVWTSDQTQYDVLGRTQAEILPYSATNNGYHWYTYDILDRPTGDTHYDGSGNVYRQTGIAYSGNKTTSTDARGYSTSRWNDVVGRLRRIIDVSPGGTTNFTYDAFGNLVKVVDATGNETTYQFNTSGFRVASSEPDSGTWIYAVNSLGEVVSETDAKNQVTTFSYDRLGRLRTRLEPEFGTPTVWTYGSSISDHNIGSLAHVSRPDGYSESYWYDSIGRVSRTDYSVDGSPYRFDYSYNSIGKTDTVTYPTSTSGYRLAVQSTYSHGVTVATKDAATGSTFWQLNATDDQGAPTSESLGNGVTVSTGFSPWTSEISARTVGNGGSTSNLANLSYAWDVAGNLISRQDLLQGLTEEFVTDPLNRIASSKRNGVPNLSVTYDAAGNIASKSDVGTYDYTTVQGGCSYHSHAQPHAVRNAGGAVYCYDANGNVTTRGGSAISWYSFNLPSQINAGGNTTQFNYNANHQRWKQVASYGGVVETTLYVGGVLEVVSKSGVTEFRHQIAAGSSTALYSRSTTGSNATHYITSDHIRSSDLITDGSGAVLARLSFTPFGARRGSDWQGVPTVGDFAVFSSTSRRGFTGHEMLDAVGLVHMNGRMYDPVIGRFLQADPIVNTPELSQAHNPYSYVMNNPLRFTDPSGYGWFGDIWKGAWKFVKKWGAPIIGVGFAMIGMPFVGALVSSSFNTAVHGGSVGSFLGGLAIGFAAGLIAGPVAGKLSSLLKMDPALIGTQVFRGSLSGGISGGLSTSVRGGSFWKGFRGGALTGGATAGIVSSYWKYRTNQFIRDNVRCVGGCTPTVTQAIREAGMSPIGQRLMSGYIRSGDVLRILPEFLGQPAVQTGTNVMMFEGNVQQRLGAALAAEPWGPSMSDAAAFLHELGHTVRGLGLIDPINVRYSENPYRLWMGLPLRMNYDATQLVDPPEWLWRAW